MNANWNPDLYLRFQKERTQPSIDLANRIRIDKPKKIIDIGCGPGNSTEILRKKWKRAEIVGIDNSKQMIDKASASYPSGKWILSDVYDLDPADKYDIVFSNAVLQWIPEHERLIPYLISLVSHGGVLAFQVPQNQFSKIHLSLYETASESKFKDYTEQAKTILNYKIGTYYYDLLNVQAEYIDIWETTYYHILDNHDELLNWYKSTGMRPFLDRLPENLKEEFIKSVKQKCISGYPVQNNNKVIFPFTRLFIIAHVK